MANTNEDDPITSTAVPSSSNDPAAKTNEDTAFVKLPAGQKVVYEYESDADLPPKLVKKKAENPVGKTPLEKFQEAEAAFHERVVEGFCKLFESTDEYPVEKLIREIKEQLKDKLSFPPADESTTHSSSIPRRGLGRAPSGKIRFSAAVIKDDAEALFELIKTLKDGKSAGLMGIDATTGHAREKTYAYIRQRVEDARDEGVLSKAINERTLERILDPSKRGEKSGYFWKSQDRFMAFSKTLAWTDYATGPWKQLSEDIKKAFIELAPRLDDDSDEITPEEQKLIKDLETYLTIYKPGPSEFARIEIKQALWEQALSTLKTGS